jgi:hypothetical protein
MSNASDFVPTASVPRPLNGTYLKSEGLADLSRQGNAAMFANAAKCAHGVTPEHCADCYSVMVEDKPARANSGQVAGSHYSKMKLQVWDFVIANEIPYMEATCIKYLCRWRDKGGVEDLKKARHFLDKLIEVSGA